MAQCCLICGNSDSKLLPGTNSLSDSDTNNSASSLEERDVIFTLRNILEIPRDVVEYYVSDLGNPSHWKLQLCSICKDAVSDAKQIYRQILESAKNYKSVKLKIIDTVKESMRKNLNDASICHPGVVTVASRKYVTNHIYSSNSDHFVLGNMATCEPFETGLENGSSNMFSLEPSTIREESHVRDECDINCHCDEYFRDAESGSDETTGVVEMGRLSAGTVTQEDVDERNLSEDNTSELDPINDYSNSSSAIQLHDSEHSEIYGPAVDIYNNDSHHLEIGTMNDESEHMDISGSVFAEECVQQEHPENTVSDANPIDIPAAQVPAGVTSVTNLGNYSRDTVRNAETRCRDAPSHVADTFEFLEALLKLDEKRPPGKRRGWKRNLNCFDEFNRAKKRKKAPSMILSETKKDPLATHAFDKTTTKGHFCRCGNVYSRTFHLTRHIKEYNIIANNDWLFCDQCKNMEPSVVKKFKREEDLRVHIRSKHEKIRPVCPTCGKSYASRGIDRHFRENPGHKQ